MDLLYLETSLNLQYLYKKLEFFMKDPKDERKILNYRILIKSSICWQRKEDFMKVTDDFANDKIDAETFKKNN